MSTWSQSAWEHALPVYNKILEHPFVRELAAGTLPKEKFIFYLQQDALYLHNYCRVLTHLASRLDNQQHMEAFLKFAADGVAVEKAMHQVFLAGHGEATAMTPSNLLYTSIQSAQCEQPVEVEAAAILPCFWVYREVGLHIAQLSSHSSANPYAQWIDTYSGAEFEQSNNLAIDICNALAEQTTPEIRERMTRMFTLCTRMEWMFWDSAYNLETWKI